MCAVIRSFARPVPKAQGSHPGEGGPGGVSVLALLAGTAAGECLLGELVQRFERGLQTLRLLQAIHVIAHSGHAVPHSVQCDPGLDEESGEVEVLDVFLHGQTPLRWKTLGSEGEGTRKSFRVVTLW